MAGEEELAQARAHLAADPHNPVLNRIVKNRQADLARVRRAHGEQSNVPGGVPDNGRRRPNTKQHPN